MICSLKLQDVIDQLDVRIMLRVPHDVLRQRRHERHGYHTAGTKYPCYSLLLCKLTKFFPFFPFTRFPQCAVGYITLMRRRRTSCLAPSALIYNTLIIISFRARLSRILSHGVQSDPEGSLWRDPPNYWEDIVYPAYVEAHEGVFENGDVEHGKPTNKVERLVLLESLETTMTEAVERCCVVIKEAAETI